MNEPTGQPRRRRLRALAVGVGLALLAFEIALQVGSYALWLGAGRESGPGGERRVVLCVGDSFTYGLGASRPARSYPAQLQEALDEARRDVFHVVNGGRPGQSTADVLRRLPRQLTEHRPEVVVLMAGYNDRWKRPEPLTPAELAEAGNATESFPLRWRTGDLVRRLIGALRGEGPEPPSPVSALYGSWIGTDFRVQFGKDGVCVVSGVVSDYRVEGDRLEIGSGEAAMELRWSRRGEQLALSGGPLAADGVILDRADADVDPAKIGRRVLEDPEQVGRLDEDGVARACEFLAENPADSPLWWRVAAAATHGIGTARVLATVDRALDRLPENDPWRAGLLRIRAGLIESEDPDGALAAILGAALIDGAGHTIPSWIETRAGGESRAAFERGLERLQPTAADRARLETMFELVTIPSERVASVLTSHVELAVQSCRAAGCEVVVTTYPSRDAVVDPAIRDGALRARALTADVAAAFDEAVPRTGWDALFVVDGHCNDAGYGLVARVVADAILALPPR